MKPFEKIIILVLVVLVIIQIIQINNINNLKNELMSSINNVQNSVSGIRSSVSSSVNNLLNQIQREDALIKTTKWNSVGVADGMVNTVCEVNFNKIEKGAVPYVLYRVCETDDWTKEKMQHNEGLNYKAEVSLDPEESYEYQIYVDGETGQGTDTSKISAIYRYAELKPDILGSYDHTEDNSRKRLTIQAYPSSKQVMEELQVKKSYINLYSNNVLIDSLEMKADEETDSDIQDSDLHNKVSNQVNIMEESIKLSVLTATIIFPDYDKVIDEITLKALYNNGFIKETQLYP